MRDLICFWFEVSLKYKYFNYIKKDAENFANLIFPGSFTITKTLTFETTHVDIGSSQI